ncbi:MAG TPA: nucleotide exchange factor GrpE [Candidatus Binatia bacterium]
MSDQDKKEEPRTEQPADEETVAIQSELASLRQQLEAKEQEAKTTYERLLRQAAELENFKKRAIREREESIRFANEALIKDLLPVIDNLERAVAHAQGGGNGKPLVEGVEMVIRGFLDVLNKYGVTQIDAMGQPFDPVKHEAMAQVESENHEPNLVIEEHHKGYLLHSRLLRPALVSVSKRGKKNDQNEVENDQVDD